MKTYTVETKDRKAVVVTGSLPIIKNMEVVGYTTEKTTVCIYSKKTDKLLATYELPEFKEFSSYTALIKHCKEVKLQRDFDDYMDWVSDDIPTTFEFSPFGFRTTDLALFNDCSKEATPLCPPTVTSTQLQADTLIAPMSYTSTGSDTPILCPSQRGFSTEQFLTFVLFLNFLFVLPFWGLYICYAVFFLGGVSDFFSGFYLFLTCFTAGIFGFLSSSKGG